MEQDIKVSIIEDDPTIRDGYAYLIDSVPGYNVISSFASYEDAIKKIACNKPDVVLLDIELPGLSGIDALPKLHKIIPDAHIIILTVYDQEEKIFRALGNGASGYLTKNSSPEKIVAATREVMEGGGPMSVHIAKLVIRTFKRNEQTPVTCRETEMLYQVATGKSRKRIAEELFIDLETVKSHIKNIYHKLNVHSKADAIKTARDNRFI